ncbi:helix-turn-helix domain-containing protein [Pseudarthrobacter sulfonivorans]|uniref:TetR/AcrR family transcriptional regulator n=1 Tax=Pseudarthrobacter sulfonivorans TaxID=121292 RepID=UPI00286735C1|nr:helix-turn-helix domain-containing protein [Pseudarthrobacter sulfonivorans]MDR6416789.1 AcrR family transcriptional regulator [Pseudarthrobacter sulfonivorans]
MSYIPLLPGPHPGPAAERRDAARNRERLLTAARELIAECGVEALTMDGLAERAGVGKGTVFRRFGSRTGLMMTLLSDSEAAFQAGFMFGAPPLGPGATALERLVAFGAARIAYVLEHGDLVRAAESTDQDRHEVPAALLSQRHVELLLRAGGMDADPGLMAMALTATLDPERLLHAVRIRGVAPERLTATWRELVTRVIGRP